MVDSQSVSAVDEVPCSGAAMADEDGIVAMDTRSSLKGPDWVSKKLLVSHISHIDKIVHAWLDLRG